MQNSRTPFDAIASRYDAQFTYTPIAAYLRHRVHKRLLHRWSSGARLLELGCGTGEDALVLAEQGIYVLATDVSSEMLRIARTKLANNPFIDFLQLDLTQLDRTATSLKESPFDGVFSNFGPINCIGDWRPLAEWLAIQLKPRGFVGLGVMARYCLWEIAWHSARGRFKTATRRLKGRATFQITANTQMMIYYPTITHLCNAFAPHFRLVYKMPLGMFLPPSEVYPVLEKRPYLLKILLTLEKSIGESPWLANFADHYWVEFQKIDE